MEAATPPWEAMTIEPAQAVLLGLVQGLTEFLPVSSSGHLVIMQDLLGVELPGLSFEVAVHGGTLAAVLAAFGAKLWRLLRGIAAVVLAGSRDPEHREAATWAAAVMVGTIPAAVAGLFLRQLWEGWFQSPQVAGMGLVLTGFILYGAGRFQGRHGPGRKLGMGRALAIGLVQAVSLTPGVSRSGSTIAAGLGVGLGRQAAAEFSFLLSIPAVGGAVLLDLAQRTPGMPRDDVTALALGAVAAAISGYAAIRALMKFVLAGRLHLFSYYVWAAGVLVIVAERLG